MLFEPHSMGRCYVARSIYRRAICSARFLPEATRFQGMCCALRTTFACVAEANGMDSIADMTGCRYWGKDSFPLLRYKCWTVVQHKQ